MNKEQVLDKEQILERYGNVKLEFDSYYKYTFTFVGVAEDGAQVSASIGGDSRDIYRMEVSADCTKTLIGLGAECANVTLNGKQVGSYDER